MSKFLDENGLLYFWSLIKTKLSSKVDKVTGKALSTNDYTTAEKTKLSGIEANANKYVHPTSTLTAGAYGDAGESRILTNSGTFKVPLVKTDANGHVIDTVVLTLTLPAGYTLPVATATALGGVKIGTGLAIANGVTTVTTAPKLATARTIALAGDVSGSVSFDGSENATITAVIADDSHNHIISNVDGLQTALDTKANATTVEATYAKKTDLTNVYKYKGSVATVANLPTTGNTSGDVYNVEARGINYAWNGTTWDALGELFEISSISNTEVDTILAS